MFVLQVLFEKRTATLKPFPHVFNTKVNRTKIKTALNNRLNCLKGLAKNVN